MGWSCWRRALWCWGGNVYGQVGIGNVVTPQTSPVQVSVGITTWRSVAGGYMHTCANRIDNSVWCWGANFSGQNGLGDYTQRTSPVQLAGVTAIGVYSGNQAGQTFMFV